MALESGAPDGLYICEYGSEGSAHPGVQVEAPAAEGPVQVVRLSRVHMQRLVADHILWFVLYIGPAAPTWHVRLLTTDLTVDWSQLLCRKCIRHLGNLTEN